MNFNELIDVFRKIISLLLLSIFLFLSFLAFQYLSVIYFGETNIISGLCGLGFAAILTAFLLYPRRAFIENVVDGLLFPKRYSQMKKLEELAQKVLSSSDRDELLAKLLRGLKDFNSGFGSVSLILKDPERPVFKITTAFGLSLGQDALSIPEDSFIIDFLKNEKKEIYLERITEGKFRDYERQGIEEEMSKLKADICFPLFSRRRNSLFGLISIGDSKIGRASYTGRNLFWLKSVMDHTAIQLDNFYHSEYADALVPFVGKPMAEQMRRNKDFRTGAKGDKVWATILMVDIRSFTKLSGQLDAQRVVEILEEFRSVVAPIVLRCGGMVDKFIGDAVMVVFGLPNLPSFKSPDKCAAECSISIMNDIQSMNSKRKDSGIHVGIGISSGIVVAGTVNSGDRREYTVIGDAVNLVARLEDVAIENQILISQATYDRLIDEDVDATPLLPKHLQGFDKEVAIYDLKRINKIKVEAFPSPNPKLI